MVDAFYIRKAFRMLLREAGLSVRKAAKLANVNPSSIQRLSFVEKPYTPTEETIRKALVALGSSWTYEDLIGSAQTLENEAKRTGEFWTESDFVRGEQKATDELEETQKLGPKYQANETQKGRPFLSTAHSLLVGTSILNAKRRTVTEDTMEPEICVGDDVLYTEVEEDCQDMAKTKDIVFGIYKETGKEALVRLRRDGDTMWGVIENRDFPGEKQRELSSVTAIVVCVIKWYKRPSNLPPL